MILCLAALLTSEAAMAEAPDSLSERAYYYHGLDYGSEAALHPFTLILNGGFHVMQVSNRSNRLADMDFQNGWDLLWLNIGNPIDAIEHDGWGDFIRTEILPFSTGLSNARYWPNYMLHLIGGGMSYRMMIEWYQYHDIKHPKIWSAGTMFLYHMLNEVAETSYLEGYTTDPVADLYLFDPLSCVLFSNDKVARFFGETMNLRDWSFQPAYDVSNGSLENVGVSYSMKWKPPFWDRTSFFYYFGSHGEGGISREMGGGYSWSVAAGFTAGELIDHEDGGLAVKLEGAGALFLDRNGSLLASLQLASTKDYSMRLNVYPGFLHISDWSPGLFVTRNNRWIVGVNVSWPSWQPLGLATSVRGFED
jgi:hypothetical protein